MAGEEEHELHGGSHSERPSPVVQMLENMDNWAHVIVAAFFILMATTVIVHMGFIFLRQLPLIALPTQSTEAKMSESQKEPASKETANKEAAGKEAASKEGATSENKTTASENRNAPKGPTNHPGSGDKEQPGGRPAEGGTASAPTTMGQGSSGGTTLTVTDTTGHTWAVSIAPPTTQAATTASNVGEAHAETAADPFVKNSLELLSNILFAVILLELLRTIITYLQTHDIQAIMQEFLVVGIISSVRKILLVGAEASLVGSKNQMEFIQEASGIVINIVGILLLILGLVMLKRAFGSKVQKEA